MEPKKSSNQPFNHTDTTSILTFLGVLAHEIHSQVAAISTTSDIMLDHPEMNSEETQEHLSTIQTTSYHILRVLDNMMSTAKFSHDNLLFTPCYSRIQVAEWLTALLRQLDLMTSVAAITIHMHIDNTVPASIVTDEVKLGQVLYNLLTNAVKATRPCTNVELHVSCQDSRLTFRITDQGEGIPEHKMNDLFQPFRQLEKGRAGTGLGLYVSKLCVTALSGEILVYSEPTGTTFTFYVTLPATS